jgi:hypothetical protein
MKTTQLFRRLEICYVIYKKVIRYNKTTRKTEKTKTANEDSVQDDYRVFYLLMIILDTNILMIKDAFLRS